jgi:hypothetical protein
MKRRHRLSCLVVLKIDVTETGFENVYYTQLFQDSNHCLVFELENEICSTEEGNS